MSGSSIHRRQERRTGAISRLRKQTTQERLALCARIRQAREEAGLNQEQAAKQLGVAQSVVSRIEAGDRRIDVVELLALAKTYGKPMTFFFEGLE